MPGPISSPPDPLREGPGRSPAGRIAGGLLILTGAVTVLSTVTRLAADADQPAAAQILEAIFLSPGLYGLGGGARLAAGLTLMAAAWCLGRSRIVGRQRGSPLIPWLLGASGGFTAVSGMAALILAVSSPMFLLLTTDPDAFGLMESLIQARWFTGKIGFTLAGLALIPASRLPWKGGRAVRSMGPLSAILGVAMQFIWVDSAAASHPVVGVAFFVWLVVAGSLLYTGRVRAAEARAPRPGA